MEFSRNNSNSKTGQLRHSSENGTGRSSENGTGRSSENGTGHSSENRTGHSSENGTSYLSVRYNEERNLRHSFKTPDKTFIRKWRQVVHQKRLAKTCEEQNSLKLPKDGTKTDARNVSSQDSSLDTSSQKQNPYTEKKTNKKIKK